MIAYNKPCISPQCSKLLFWVRQCCTREPETTVNFLGEAGDKIKQNTWFSFNPIPNFDLNCLQLCMVCFFSWSSCYTLPKGPAHTGKGGSWHSCKVLRGSAHAKHTLMSTKLQDWDCQRAVAIHEDIWPKRKPKNTVRLKPFCSFLCHALWWKSLQLYV